MSRPSAIGEVCYRFTDVTDGDLSSAVPPDQLAARRAALVDLPWRSLEQVHDAGVVTVEGPGAGDEAAADAAITTVAGVVLTVRAADCATVLLAGDGAFGVVHAGWRGLRAGVIDAAVEALRTLGHPPRSAVLGPCIRGRCYEFDDPARDDLADVLGSSVLATTAWGTPALDLAAGVVAACAAHGLAVDDLGTCTACSPRHWSHRARSDGARHALVAWMEPRDSTIGRGSPVNGSP